VKILIDPEKLKSLSQSIPCSFYLGKTSESPIKKRDVFTKPPMKDWQVTEKDPLRDPIFRVA
jgi:hypothetical protein